VPDVPWLPDLLVGEAFGVLLVFARVGSALMILPGFGEPYILSRFRLLLALLLSLGLAAPLAAELPAPPEDALELARLLGTEALFGLFVGGAVRALFAALHVAGTVIAFQSGLAAAAIFDPNEATQGTLPGNFLTTTALVLLFVTDAHHLLLAAVAASYEALPAGGAPPFGDMAELIGRLVDQAFALGVRIAAPLLVVSLLMYLAMGVLNRLMPAFQVFFLALPLQMLLAFATLMLSLAGGLFVFFALLEDSLTFLIPGG
jgi:flagellar biosynthesis protein FliR